MLEPRADLAPVLAAVADGLSGDGFAIRFVLPDAMPPLAIDGRTLEAILTTLADNARQAGASDLAIAVRVEDDAALLDLTDNGPGVAPGDRDRIFDPFFTTKRATGGTGLGLSIARSLMQSYGGTLRLLPSDGGAHFELVCGLAPANPTPAR